MKKIISISALAMTLVATLITQTSCSTEPEVTPSESNHWQVGEHWQYSPQAIWGDTFVGVEYIYGDGLEAQYVSTYDLRTREKKRILELDPAEFRVGPPSIYENRIVWSSANISGRLLSEIDWDKLNYDIFLLDLDTGEVRQITNEEHAQIEPRVYGDTIVWLDNRHEEGNEYPHHFDVYAYDLKDGKERRITATNSIRERDLTISGSLVVWTDSRNDNPSSRIDTYPPVSNEDIYLYDLSTNQERRITTDLASDSAPVVDNGRIVWIRSPKVREADIFLYDVNTGEKTRISMSGYAARDYYPAIYGDRIVWADARISRGNTAGDVVEGDKSGAAEIYLYNLGSQQETLLVPSAGTEFTMNSGGSQDRRFTDYQVWLNPVIHGDFIIYTLTRQIGSMVHAMRLDDK